MSSHHRSNWVTWKLWPNIQPCIKIIAVQSHVSSVKYGSLTFYHIINYFWDNQSVTDRRTDVIGNTKVVPCPILPTDINCMLSLKTYNHITIYMQMGFLLLFLSLIARDLVSSNSACKQNSFFHANHCGFLTQQQFRKSAKEIRHQWGFEVVNAQCRTMSLTTAQRHHWSFIFVSVLSAWY